jgi:hypothetical protein
LIPEKYAKDDSIPRFPFHREWKVECDDDNCAMLNEKAPKERVREIQGQIRSD